MQYGSENQVFKNGHKNSIDHKSVQQNLLCINLYFLINVYQLKPIIQSQGHLSPAPFPHSQSRYFIQQHRILSSPGPRSPHLPPAPVNPTHGKSMFTESLDLGVQGGQVQQGTLQGRMRPGKTQLYLPGKFDSFFFPLLLNQHYWGTQVA